MHARKRTAFGAPPLGAPPLGDPNGYLLYRITFLGVRLEAANSIQLGAVRFFVRDPSGSSDTPLPFPTNAYDVSNPGGSSPAGESCHNLARGSPYSKWLDFNIVRSGSSTLEFALTAPQRFIAYSFRTANDEASRDPISWSVFGASDCLRNWVLLDQQFNQDPPTARFTNYALYFIPAAPVAAPVAPVVVAVEGEEEWLRGPLLPEYSQLSERIVVRPELMQRSNMHSALAFLRSRPSGGDDFNSVALKAVYKAYGVHNEREARFLSSEGAPVLSSVLQASQGMGWREPFLVAALEVLTAREEPSGLIGIMELLARAGSTCNARRVHAFGTVVVRAFQLATDVERCGVRQTESHSGPPPILLASPDLAAAYSCVLEFACCFLEDFKYKAFKTAFLEPAKIAFILGGDRIAEGDVDVHGSNVYAAALLASIRVRLPLAVFFQDDAKGTTSFLQVAQLHREFDLLMEPGNFGRDWRAVRGLCVPRLYYRASDGELVVRGISPAAIARQLVDASPRSQQVRAEFSRYLERFVHFFSREGIFLERLFNALI
eukprot:gnl/Spiro4/6047_TR3103_c0_g1_i1.p1 gnl/Spiro4/6047_TR3103_c0_g1~~gnl/Spiro4/6047_TR3103_c0_g1_i1.p1  ORF type:complete len:555 (+),score=105.83 gnl/Spiro4/6047_TR3103_c0_g1_i1:25-1665(+)